MPSKKYVLKLSAEERSALVEVVQQPRSSRWKVLRARALLKCDQGPSGPGWSDARIAEALECTVNSLENWRKQAALQGPLSLLERQPYHRRTPPKVDGEAEARLTALACSPAPRGHRHEQMKKLVLPLLAAGLTPDAVFVQLRGTYEPDVSDREIHDLITWAVSKTSARGTDSVVESPSSVASDSYVLSIGFEGRVL